MGAKFINQTDLSFAVAKANQALPHQLHADRRAIGLRNFRRQKEWCPVASQQLAHDCSRANAAELIVLFTRHHGDVSSSLCYVSGSLSAAIIGSQSVYGSQAPCLCRGSPLQPEIPPGSVLRSRSRQRSIRAFEIYAVPSLWEIRRRLNCMRAQPDCL